MTNLEKYSLIELIFKDKNGQHKLLIKTYEFGSMVYK